MKHQAESKFLSLIVTFAAGCAFLLLTGCLRPMTGKHPGVLAEDPFATGTESSPDSSMFLDSLEVPSGVDSSVAYSATLTANRLMVSFREDSIAARYAEAAHAAKEVANPLLELWEKGKGKPDWELSHDDSVKWIDTDNKAYQQWNYAEQVLGQPIYLVRDDEMALIPENIRKRTARILERARDHYERSLSMNPWDMNTRLDLVNIYRDLAKVHRSLDDVDDAISEWQIISSMDETDYIPHYELASLFKLKNQPGIALQQLHIAEDKLVSWASLINDPPYGDSLMTRFEDAEITSWLGIILEETALDSILELEDNLMADSYRIKALVRPGNDQDSVTLSYADYYLKHLSWNDGDLRSWQLYSAIDNAYINGNFHEARKLMRDIRPRLTNDDAAFEIDTLSAYVDFYFLGEQDNALTRIRSMLTRAGFAEPDSSLDSLLVQLPPEDFSDLMEKQRKQADFRTLRLVDLYGDMCLRMALELEKDPHFRQKSFIYYYQSSLIPSGNQAYSLLLLAYLSRNQPEQQIRYAEACLPEYMMKQLNNSDRKLLFDILVNAYRQLGNKPMVEYYNQMRLSYKPGNESSVQ